MEHLEIEEPDAKQHVDDTESAVFGDGTGNGSDSGKEPVDDFDLYYNPFRDHKDDLASVFLGRAPSIVQLGWIITIRVSYRFIYT